MKTSIKTASGKPATITVSIVRYAGNSSASEQSSQSASSTTSPN